MTKRLILILALSVLPAIGCQRKQAPPPEPEPQEAARPSEKTAEPTKAGDTLQVPQEAPKPPASDGLGPGTEAQQQLLIQAKTAFLREDWDAAEVAFEKLTKTGDLSGPQVTAYIALGQIYRESDRVEQARGLFEELVNKAPNIAEVHFVLARTYAEQGEATKAIKAYEKTITLQHDYLQAMVELAGLYTTAGRKEEGERLFYKYEKRIHELAKKLEDKELPPEEQLRLLDIFSFVDDDRANQAISTALFSQDPFVRERAIWLCVDNQVGGVKGTLQNLADLDPDRRVRASAVEALRMLEDVPEVGHKPKFVKSKKELPVKQ